MNQKVNFNAIDVFTEILDFTNKKNIVLRGDFGRAGLRVENLYTLKRTKVLS